MYYIHLKDGNNVSNDAFGVLLLPSSGQYDLLK